jgi:hypothetical protein
VLPADDVVYLMWEICIVFVEQAVFAAVLRSLGNQPA